MTRLARDGPDSASGTAAQPLLSAQCLVDSQQTVQTG